eukprot:4272828-Pleurochrysis_carterae.AAC.1
MAQSAVRATKSTLQAHGSGLKRMARGKAGTVRKAMAKSVCAHTALEPVANSEAKPTVWTCCLDERLLDCARCSFTRYSSTRQGCASPCTVSQSPALVLGMNPILGPALALPYLAHDHCTINSTVKRSCACCLLQRTIFLNMTSASLMLLAVAAFAGCSKRDRGGGKTDQISSLARWPATVRVGAA